MSPVTKVTLACVVLLASASRTARSQPSMLAFEVVDIKPSAPSNSLKRKAQVLPGGRLEIPNATLKDLMAMAYGVRDAMIIGGPEWADNQHFDVLAKASSDASMPALRLMMQTLLAERFRLVIHREDRVMRAYVLTVGNPSLPYCHLSVPSNQRSDHLTAPATSPQSLCGRNRGDQRVSGEVSGMRSTDREGPAAHNSSYTRAPSPAHCPKEPAIACDLGS
jgi:uncharacterized protein (TIGR03435 family)